MFLFALFSPANFKPAKDKGPLGQAAHSHSADTEAEYEELEKSRECQRCGEAMRRLFHLLRKGVWKKNLDLNDILILKLQRATIEKELP